MKPHYYKPYLYAAYGSNLHEKQMLARCPRAERVSVIMLPDYRLVFRGVADVEECEGSEVPVGLWSITGHCNCNCFVGPIRPNDDNEEDPRCIRKCRRFDVFDTCIVDCS